MFTKKFWTNVGLAALAAFTGSFATALAGLDAPLSVDLLVGLITSAAYAALRVAGGIVAAAAGSEHDK